MGHRRRWRVDKAVKRNQTRRWKDLGDEMRKEEKLTHVTLIEEKALEK